MMQHMFKGKVVWSMLVGNVIARVSLLGDPGIATSPSFPLHSLVEFLSSERIEPRIMEF
ncbi:hypothetical protein A2U01_0056074, partial [Trifolium medium]|nr:hypothetical protein [Trifolium medium]